MNRSTFRTLSVAAVLAFTSAGLVPAAQATPAAPSAAKLPRYCVAEFTVPDSKGAVTSVAYEDGEFLSLPMTGLKVAPGARMVQPVGFDPDPTTPRMTSLVITADGLLQSVTSTLKNPGEDNQAWSSAKPVRIGHGWNQVSAVALPGTPDDPYLFAVLGDRLNRYTLGVSNTGTASVRSAPHAATSGFRTVRSLTWTRSTTVRGVAADVLVGLDGSKLVEYTVPRKTNPRVSKRELGTGWGSVKAISAGLCFTDGRDTAELTRSTPILARVGRDVRLYLDRTNTDGSGRDILNYGRIGAWPAA